MSEQKPTYKTLRAFALWALNGYRTDCVGDIDGKHLEDKALELGLLVESGEGYSVSPNLLKAGR